MTRPPLTLIVATDAERGIGIGNALPWRLPEDLAYFKRMTSGHAIVMGRKTFESIGRPLPNRRNIVISRNPAWQASGAETAASIDEALAMLPDEGGFVIGGGEIYRTAIERANRLLVTEIDARFECDTFFPHIDATIWHETARETHHSDTCGFDFAFVTYERRS